MATYVLVHGGLGHGGWCWKKVTPLLRGAGHDVYTPTLTGVGERSHLSSLDITLDTHIQDIVNVLYYEDLTDVILVGHSYGGMIITGVADRARERLAHLIYLDAFVPRDGESAAGLMQRAGAPPTTSLTLPVPIQIFGVTDEAEVAWAQPRLTTTVNRGGRTPLRLSNPDILATIPRTFILCTAFDHPLNGVRQFAAPARHDLGWRYRELEAGHDAMITHPRETAALLLEVASSVPSP